MKLFPTLIQYESAKKSSSFNRGLIKECYQLMKMDDEGRTWSKKNYPGGYTSYSSLSKLHEISSTFESLKKTIDAHVLKYARSLEMDLTNSRIEMTNLWVNIVPKHTYHGLHLHPNSVISGTFYLQTPKNSGAIKFEDPRLTCFMGSIPRIADAKPDNRRFISIDPKPGMILLFESWIRHEVMQNLSSEDRISVSFNYENTLY